MRDLLKEKLPPDGRKAHPELRNMRRGTDINAGPTTGDRGRKHTLYRRLGTGVSALCRPWLCVGLRGCYSEELHGQNGSKLHDYRDQRYEEK